MNSHDALLGMALQAVGVTLLALLSWFLARSVGRAYMKYWAAAWAAMALALASLGWSFGQGRLSRALPAFYFLGEYAFAYLFVAGCRNYIDGRRPAARDAWLAAPACALALALTAGYPPGPISLRAMLHAAVLLGVFAFALRLMWPLRHGPRSGPGMRILLLAIALLAADFAHYVALLGYVALRGLAPPFAYLAYTPAGDLLLQFLLGFGTVMLVMEDTNRRLAEANRELRTAKERLETVARIDPLTDSLNRHALHSVIEEQRGSASVGGSVAVVDIDNLKGINDTHGHAAGDAAIRSVASAIRALVRADDLVFRWGGDEFLLLLFGLSERDARNRLSGVNPALSRSTLAGAAGPVDVAVSVGVAPIEPGVALDKAIEAADDAMYRHKNARRAQGGG